MCLSLRVSHRRHPYFQSLQKSSQKWTPLHLLRVDVLLRPNSTIRGANTAVIIAATMENSCTSGDDPLQAKLRRKRRRRKRKSSPAQSDNDANLGDDHVGWRHHTTAATTSSSNCNALDVELENQVNKLIVQSNHDRKKRLATASYNTTICAVNTKSANDMSSTLPMFLHIRELGLSSHLGRHRKQIPFISNVDSLDVNGNNASWMTLLLHQPAYPGRKERMDQQCRHSGLTLDTAAANDNDHQDNSNGTRWLRAPVQNRHALHNDDYDDNYNKGSISKDALTIYRRKSWRPYTLQTIQFSKLKTPHSVAILAMDQWGGYSIGVTAGMDGSVVGRGDLSLLQPYLSLKYYGIPSPARLLNSNGKHSASPKITSPLAHSIPLLLNNLQYNNSGSEEAPIQISDTPIQILLCSNGAFGVGYVLDSRATAPLRSDIFSKSPALLVSVLCFFNGCHYCIPITCLPIYGVLIIGRLYGNGGHLRNTQRWRCNSKVISLLQR